MAKPTNGTTQAGGGVTPEPTDELLGTWKFNETPNFPEMVTGDPISFFIEFEFFDGENTHQGTGITLEYADGEGTSLETPIYCISYEARTAVSSVPEIIAAYWSRNEPDFEATVGWQNTSLRTITITDTSSLTNRDEFTTWLKANAVKQDAAI